MRAMATDDLEQVATRLKSLRHDLQKKTGEAWIQQDVAEAVKVPLRTFASWEGGEVENRDGEGYKRLARFYSRKLGRKVSWQWIVFGAETPPERDEPPPSGSPLDALSPPLSADLDRRLEWIESALQALLVDRDLPLDAPPSRPSPRPRTGSSPGGSGNG